MAEEKWTAAYFNDLQLLSLTRPNHGPFTIVDNKLCQHVSMQMIRELRRGNHGTCHGIPIRDIDIQDNIKIITEHKTYIFSLKPHGHNAFGETCARKEMLERLCICL